MRASVASEGQPREGKQADCPSRPKLRQCLLAANGIPTIQSTMTAEAFGIDHPKPTRFRRRLWVALDPS
jgi:hypothetical protein